MQGEGVQCHTEEFNLHHRNISVAGGEAAAVEIIIIVIITAIIIIY